MASHYVPCDDVLDRIAAARATGPTPLDADPSDYQWKAACSRLMRESDDMIVVRAQSGTDGEAFTRWAARQLRDAIRSGTRDPDLSAVVDALYDDEQEQMDEESQREHDEFQRAGGFE